MKFPIYSQDGQELVPISDGIFETLDMTVNDRDLRFSNGTLIIVFYGADGETVVTPLTGTIEVTASPIEGQWLNPSCGDSLIDATTVSAGLATYSVPVFPGPIIKGRIDLQNITGADFFKAYFWRS